STAQRPFELREFQHASGREVETKRDPGPLRRRLWEAARHPEEFGLRYHEPRRRPRRRAGVPQSGGGVPSKDPWIETPTEPLQATPTDPTSAHHNSHQDLPDERNRSLH